MVILVAGASHTGKTLLAQRMLEEYRCPYLSIDHLKIEITIWGQSLFGYYSESAGRWLVNGNTKRGLSPNGYKVKVKLTAPANEYYNAAKPKTIVLKVRIRK